MKNGIALSIFLILALMPLHAEGRKHEKPMHQDKAMREWHEPPMHEWDMPRRPAFDMEMPSNGRRFSEVQIRGRLKQRYMMSDADIDIILKARKQILDVMEKYQALPSGN